MITAKPLKTKGLGEVPAAKSTTDPAPLQNQTATIIEPIQDQTATKESRDYNLTELIKQIVFRLDGISARDTYNLYSKFCNTRKLELADYDSVYAILRKLVDKEEITRLKIGKIYYYYKRVA